MNYCLCTLLGLIMTANMLAQQTVGLFQNDDLATEGYVLFGNNETTYLIDNCGFIVNTWESDYDPGQGMYLLENGNLLRTARVDGSFNAGGLGGRFELFSWEGELLWHFEYTDNQVHAHHDIAPLANGNFLAIAWEKHSASEAKQLGRIYDGDVWSEKIVEIEMVYPNQANIVWEWRLWDHLVQDVDSGKPNYGILSEHPQLVNLNYIGEGENASGDWVHFNAIDYNEDLDQIALSSRNFSEIWIIDHSTTTAEATTNQGGEYGKGGDLLYRFGNPHTYGRGTSQDQIFFRPHDIRWIPEGFPQEGKLMIFNNDAAADASSIEIWSPPIDQNGFYSLDNSAAFGPLSIDWTYSADDFYSENMSGAHLLPNGNIFVCEGRDGRFFEMTPEQEIIWEYINPVNKNGGPTAQGGTVRFNEVFRATKYPINYKAFEGKDLLPGSPVEINPWESDCDTSKVVVPTPDAFAEFKILGNPVEEELVIEAAFSEPVASLQIIDLQGRMIKEVKIYNQRNEIDCSRFPPGLYFIRFLMNGEDQAIEKMVKL